MGIKLGKDSLTKIYATKNVNVSIANDLDAWSSNPPSNL